MIHLFLSDEEANGLIKVTATLTDKLVGLETNLVGKFIELLFICSVNLQYN